MTQQQRDEKSLRRWEKIKCRPRTNFYVIYIIFIISLIYTVDEIASQIGMLMKTEIANDLLARFGDSSVGALEIISIIGVPFQILGLMYRPLADKWGRKPFLVINTFGMSFALLTIYLSQNLFLYVVGACLVQFFIPHDMHVVYIMETTPRKHRAKIYSSIKFIATLGVMLVPLLRKLLMQSASQWRNVYFVPALVGLVATFFALLFAKETDTFIDSKIAYLKMSHQQRQEAKHDGKNSQGGLLSALKFAFKHKQLRWLYVVTAFVNLGFVGTVNYQVTLSYGFADAMYGNFSSDVMNAVSLGPVNFALLVFPVGCALSQLLMGFISDRYGRKPSAIAMAVLSLLCFLAFFFGIKLSLNAYAVGLLCGAFIGSYYALNDVMIIMVGESAPTNLRSSIMSAQFVVTAIGGAISYAIGLPLVSILGNTTMGVISLCLLVPGFVTALVLLWKFTHDTKGVDVDKVTGYEWD